jgi:hypothetical protein
MYEELHLFQVNEAWELQNELLWVHTETLRLPTYQLTLILI